MGKPKSLLQIDGLPILAWLHDRFDWPGPTLLVLSSQADRPPGAERFDAIAVDAVKGNGPLQGLLAALRAASTDHVAVVTIDMPGVGSQHIEWLLNELASRPRLQGLMCRRDAEAGVIEPFPSLFRKSASGVIAQYLASDRRSVHGLCDSASIKPVPAPQQWSPDTWLNLNFPEQLAAFQSTRSGDRP